MAQTPPKKSSPRRRRSKGLALSLLAVSTSNRSKGLVSHKAKTTVGYKDEVGRILGVIVSKLRELSAQIKYAGSCTQKECRGRLGHMFHSPIVAIAVVYLIWGMAAPITKLALMEIGPMSLLFLRMVIASLILFPFVLRKHTAFTLHEQMYTALSSFFAMFLPILLIYIALPLIPSVNVPIVDTLSPFFLIILARIFLRERVPSRKFFGIFFCFVGVMCVTLLPALFKSQGEVLGASRDSFSYVRDLYFSGKFLTPANSVWVGNMILVLAVFLGSVGTLFIKPIKHLPGYVIAFWQFSLAACFALPFALSETINSITPQLGLYGWVGIIYTGVLSSVVAYSLYDSVVRKVNVADIGIFSYLAPLGALMLAIPLLHEYPSPWFIIGSGLVLLGVWVGERKLRKRNGFLKSKP